MDTRALYRSLFIRKVSHESAVDFELPTLHMILLYVEWFIGQECVPAVATFVSTEVMRRKLKNTKEFIAEFNKILDNSEFVEELRRIVGSEVYDYACAAIGDGETSIPLGLAPTLQMFYESCKTCGVPKYIRSFCLRCGLIHDVSNKEVVYCGLSSRGKRMVRSKTENDSMRTKNSIIVSSSSSDLSLTRLSTVDNVRRLETTDFIAPKSIPLVVKAVSLEKLMALHRQQKALQSNEVKLPDDDGILAIEVMKSQPVIIDLISDDESDTAVFVSDKAHAPYTSQIATESDSDSEDVIVKSEPICALSTSWVVKKEVATSGYLETSESSSDITAAESTELNGGIDPDQVAVKMEWPARRMNKYEMAAMRGIAALYKYGQSKVNPGDMLFLMRNLATNCSGLHRIAARCGFKKLCTQWAAEHKTHHSNDSECDVLDVIEGAFTLAQLINPANRSWDMYQENDNIYADSDSTTATTTTTHTTGASQSSSSAQDAPLWENAEGRQESEYDFATRIDFALSCSNLKFMIYSLTGDRHYHSLKSEPGEDICVAMELIGDTMLDCNASKKQRLEAARGSASCSNGSFRGTSSGGTSRSASSGASAGPAGATSSAAVTVSAAALAMTAAVGFRPELTNHALQRQAVAASRSEGQQATRRRSTSARNTKRQLFENLSEEFGSYDNFGNVTPEIGQHFMEYASVLASCKVFIKENLRYISLPDFIGVDLDRFQSADAGRLPGDGAKGGDHSSSSTSSSSSSKSSQSHKKRAAGGGGQRTHKDNLIDSNQASGREVFTGALCWPYITEEVGFDADLRIDKTLVNYRVKESTLSKAVSKLATVRVYHPMSHFTHEGGSFDREGYKQQCYFVTHVIYAFSDWGQHPLRRQLFAEEFEFLVTNAASILEVLKDAELVGEVLQCLRILQYTPKRDPGLVELFEDGMDFLLKVEKDFGCMGKWVATRSSKREEIYTQYHATYCAVVGLAEPPFSKDEKLLLNPPVSRLLRHLQSADEPQYLL